MDRTDRQHEREREKSRSHNILDLADTGKRDRCQSDNREHLEANRHVVLRGAYLKPSSWDLRQTGYLSTRRWGSFLLLGRASFGRSVCRSDILVFSRRL